MKQTAVEWLYERLERMIPRTALYNIDKKEYFEQAKEMEKKQIADEFAIGFAEWISYRYKYLDNKGWFATTYHLEMGIFKSSKELLEIYKKEKGL